MPSNRHFTEVDGEWKIWLLVPVPSLAAHGPFEFPKVATCLFLDISSLPVDSKAFLSPYLLDCHLHPTSTAPGQLLGGLQVRVVNGTPFCDWEAVSCTC